MTIGIYCISFEGTEAVYIGQSGTIEQRFMSHLCTMKKGQHHNKYVNEAYSQYGTPTFEILEVCTRLELDEKEKGWIAEFDSCKNGLNIGNGGASGGSGCYGPTSKYREEQVILAMTYLGMEKLYNSTQIEELTGVARAAVRLISCGKSHTWLEEVYPIEYLAMRNNQKLGRVGTAYGTVLAAVGQDLPTLIAPDGEEYEVENIREFCRLFQLDRRHLSRVIQGVAKSHKGFSLKIAA